MSSKHHMDGEHQVHIFFIPLMAHGHMIPLVDMAKLFALRGVKTTIITTPMNAPLFSKTIQKVKDSGAEITTQIIKFPSVEAGLPEGCENADQLTSQYKGMELLYKFVNATAMLQEPLQQLLEEYHPNCIVSDALFPWTSDVAAKFGIPRLVFHGTGFFPLCTAECMRLYEPHKKVSSDSEPFVVPNLPGDIKFTRKQVPDHQIPNSETGTKLMEEARASELKSFGVLVNSFYELEPAYADFYREVLGRRAWHVGPVSLCNREIEDKACRGKEAAIDEHECLKWLDSKLPNSVAYLCFGSIANFTAAQLKEIAIGLEASGQDFIWVVRKDKKNEDSEDWLPEGFEKRMEGKGLIIRGWAPQVLILDHEAVGGFVTHCGWNSTLEGITAGKPMVTWPVSAEQFYNEKLVTQVLRIGIRVGVKEWVRIYGDSIKSEAIEKAVTQIMVGEEAEEMRSRAQALGKLARRAVEEGGSSHSQLDSLIAELRMSGI